MESKSQKDTKIIILVQAKLDKDNKRLVMFDEDLYSIKVFQRLDLIL